jgi:solute carrier family 25 protein 33/36
MQSSQGAMAFVPSTSAAGGADVPGAGQMVRLSSPKQVFLHIVRHEGVLALYKGLLSSVLGVGPSRAIYFGSQNATKRFLRRRFELEGAALHLSSAAVAGVVANTVMSPWWVIRVRLQLQRTPIVAPTALGRGAADAATTAAATGTGASVLGATHSAAASVAGASAARGLASDAVSTVSARATGLAASATSAAAAAAAQVVPSAHGEGYKGILDCATRIYREEGLRTFYRGLMASYLGVIEAGVQFTMYGYLKDDFLRRNNGHEGPMLGLSPNASAVFDHERHRESMLPAAASPSAVSHATAGAGGVKPGTLWTLAASGISKLVAAATTYPHEVIRTRMREQRAGTDGSLRYRGIVQSARLVMREEGWRALYGGMSVHLLKTVPNAAILIAVVERLVGGNV